MVFKDRSVTRLDDFGSDGKMKLSSVLKLFENAADHHRDAVSDDEMRAAMGSSEWILTQWDVLLHRLPHRSEKLFVDTWIVGKGPAVRADREFVMRSAEGDVLAEGETKLSLFDVEAQRIVRVSEVIIDKYGPETEKLWQKKLPKLKEPEEFDLTGVVPLRRSDLDYNRHIHNTAYLDLACELVPEAVLKADPKGFRVQYKHQLKEGDLATVKVRHDGDTLSVAIFSGEVLCALVEVRG